MTIGLPVYNGEEYIEEALISLLSQTYTNFKLIISDNYSTDGTPRLCKKYEKKDPRIKYIRQQKNIGAIPNFHFLLNQASSKYFMWASDDDLWDETYLETCIERFEKNDKLDMVYTRYIVISNNTKKHFFLNHNWYLRSKYNKWIFLLLDETITHKANMIYGVWKTKSIKTLVRLADKYGLDEKYTGKGFDNAFLTMALGYVKIYQVQRSLFFKRYFNMTIPGTLRSFIKASIVNLMHFTSNPIKYVRNSIRESRDYIEVIRKVNKEPLTIRLWCVYKCKMFLHLIFRYIL